MLESLQSESHKLTVITIILAILTTVLTFLTAVAGLPVTHMPHLKSVAVYIALPYGGVCSNGPTDSSSIELHGTWGLLPVPVTVSTFVTPDMCP